MKLIIEVIGSLAYFVYNLFETFFTNTDYSSASRIYFHGSSRGFSGYFQTYLIAPGSQETWNKETFFRSLKYKVKVLIHEDTA